MVIKFGIGTSAQLGRAVLCQPLLPTNAFSFTKTARAE
jgi:hypothetical protein